MGVGRIRAAVLGAALALGVTAASAQEVNVSATARAPVVTVRVCNASPRNAKLALIYRDMATERWRGSGWTDLAGGACKDIARTDNFNFFAFAEEAGNVDFFWGGDFPQCVTRPGPFNIELAAEARPCGETQDAVNFVRLRANGPGVFTWTLDP